MYSEDCDEKPREVSPVRKENLSVPKHRFDCVNLAFKETKQKLAEAAARLDDARVKLAKTESALLDSMVERELALNGARNIAAVKALIDFSRLDVEGSELKGLKEQIARIKDNHGYLFAKSVGDTVYMMIPVKNRDKTAELLRHDSECEKIKFIKEVILCTQDYLES